MTQLLQRAFEQAAALPEDDQDFLAEMILDEIAQDQTFDELLASPRSLKVLEKLAAEAMAEHRAGLTMDLDETFEEMERGRKTSLEVVDSSAKSSIV